ncbi:GntR family transcriptional regulator [Amycolatopsis ultiminotia]|uniref:GntR family transcriptional regulator n=1 Tax=Amycolatopsis ultiminotia TaxID=543629 RepID=A0ABP6XUY6_9PSEU
MSTTVNHVIPATAPSLADRAYEFLLDQLVMLGIRPGDPINEEWASSALGMGRTPIREALKRLETERLVIAYPRRGTFATEVNISDLAHISQVRHILEPTAAAAAATNATDHDREQLAALRDRLGTAASADNRELLRTDLDLHRAIYRCVHNPFFEDTLIHYDNLATRIWCVFLPRLHGMAGHVGEHLPLLTAVAEGDADKAAELTLDHVISFEKAIRVLI